MNSIEHNTGEIVMYQPDETIKLEVRLEDETVWLTQAQIANLFQKAKSTISFHISNIFKEGELNEKVVVRKYRTTTLFWRICNPTSASIRICNPVDFRLIVWRFRIKDVILH